MAITYVGTGGQATSTTSGATITASFPAGYTAIDDDVAIVVCSGRHNNGSSLAPSDPSGYTLVDTVFREIGSYDIQTTVWIKRLTAGESAPATTIPSAYSTISGGISIQCAVFSGVNLTTLQDVTAVTSSSSASTTFTPTGLTTITDDAFVLSVVTTADDNALALLSGSEQGFTSIMHGGGYDTTTGSDHSVGLAYKEIYPAGSVTCPTWNQVSNGPDAWVALTLAFKPEPEAPWEGPEVYYSNEDYATGGTTLAVNKPTGAVAGDMVLIFAMNQEWGGGGIPSTNPPSGFSQLTATVQAAGDGFNWVAINTFYKILDGSEGSTFSLTWSGSATGSSLFAATIGVSGCSGVNSYSTFAGGAWTLDRDITTVTTTEDNCLLFGSLISFAGEDDSPSPSGWTALESFGSSPDNAFVWTKQKATAGASGTTTFDETDSWTLRAGHTVALAPATGGSPQTWTGSDSNVTVTPVSGVFTPGSVVWTGSNGNVTVTPTSGLFTPGSVVWTGSDSNVTVTPTSGLFVPGSVTWVGSNGNVTVTPVSGLFVPGSVTWVGSNGNVTVTPVSGVFTPGSVVWTGSNGNVTVTPVSGVFVADGGPQTWFGSTSSIVVTPTSGLFVPGSVTWVGSNGNITVTPTSGLFVPGSVTWVGSNGNITVTPTSGLFVPGSVTWVGSNGNITVTPTSGVFLPGSVTWVGSNGNVTVTPVSGLFTPGSVTWVGSDSNVTVTPVSGLFTPGSVTWVGSDSNVTVTPTSGLFTPGSVVWTGSNGNVTVTPVSGVFVADGGPQTWFGSTSSIVVTPTSGLFVPGSVTWVGSNGNITVTPTSGVFLPGSVTWVGSNGNVTVTPVSGLFTPGSVTWVGSNGNVTVTPTSGLFTLSESPQVWIGSNGNVTVTAVSGNWTPNEVIWGGSNVLILAQPVSGSWIPGSVTWVGSQGYVSVQPISGLFSSKEFTIEYIIFYKEPKVSQHQEVELSSYVEPRYEYGTSVGGLNEFR
jgi:hypothetical protein